MKKTMALIASLWAAAAYAQVYNGETYGDQQFGAWKSHLVKHDNDSRFRASAVSTNGNWSLNVDVVPPTCGIMISASLWAGDSPVPTDIPSHDFMGAIRIDQENVWDVRFNNSASMGDQMLMYTAYTLPDLPKFLTQMESGTTVRLKVQLFSGQSPVYVAFPLNGFSPAIRTETNICMAAFQQPESKSAAPPKAKSKPASAGDKFL